MRGLGRGGRGSSFPFAIGIERTHVAVIDPRNQRSLVREKFSLDPTPFAHWSQEFVRRIRSPVVVGTTPSSHPRSQRAQSWPLSARGDGIGTREYAGFEGAFPSKAEGGTMFAEREGTGLWCWEVLWR